MAVQIQLRRGTAAQWTSADPTLAEGELGVELDTGKLKIGSGTDAWSALPYYGGAIYTVNGQTGDVVLGVDDLDGVDLTGITTGQTIVWNGTSFVAGDAGVSNLADLGDVDLTGLTTGQTIIWNGTSFVAGESGAVDSVNGQTGDVTLAAGDIAVTPVGSLAGDNVQAALAELDSDLSAVASTASGAASAASTAQSTADGAVTDAAAAQSTADGAVTDAAAASSAASAAQSTADSAVTAAAAAQSTADSASTAASAAQSDIDAHEAATVGAHAASAISRAPTAGISSTDVDSALAELDTKKADVSYVDATLMTVGTFSGTAIEPSSNVMREQFSYTGTPGAPATFTGFGSLAAIPDGYEAIIIGQSDSNTLVMPESDTSDGWLHGNQGDFELGRGMTATYRYNAALSRMVLIGRT